MYNFITARGTVCAEALFMTCLCAGLDTVCVCSYIRGRYADVHTLSTLSKKSVLWFWKETTSEKTQATSSLTQTRQLSHRDWNKAHISSRNGNSEIFISGCIFPLVLSAFCLCGQRGECYAASQCSKERTFPTTHLLQQTTSKHQCRSEKFKQKCKKPRKSIHWPPFWWFLL